jgi:pimeloyl-ACP methyl ester carboxylesterase
MDFAEINGGRVAYELLGPEDGRPLVLTPGGRYSMAFPGVRELAEALADGGMRVLMWDRPNSGLSDVQFFGRSESHMRADTLAALLRELDLGPVVLAGGSGGARDSMLTTLLYPELVSKLLLWNIVGGVYGQLALCGYYVMPNLTTVTTLGMEGVAALPGWQETITANPRNRERLLTFDPDQFFRVFRRWMDAFVPKTGQTIPGIDDLDFEDLRVPTLIIRGGEHDVHHPKRTSLEVSTLIKGSTIVDPPWPEDAWERAGEKAARGVGSVFSYWHTAAPLMLRFIAAPDPVPAA